MPHGFGDWTGDQKYELRGTLGAGAMGVVLDGFDRQIERRVAIKVVRKPAPDDAEAVEAAGRFKREAQAAGRLSHPGIVGVYDYGENDSTAWIVMEMVHGGTLKALLDREERLPLRETARIMGQVLAALAYAHGRGVIHRDIKPANVMLTEEGDAKLADFGIARIENSAMTQVGTLMGTPSYMAPEQLRGDALDARADIWAAGVMLYQLLTGKKPFTGDITALIHNVLNTEPPPPSARLPSLPPALDAVVARALAKRTEDRWPDARAFAAALEAAAAAPAVAREEPEDATCVVTPPRVIASSSPPAASPARSGRPAWLLPAAGLGALAALGAGALLLIPRGEAPSPPLVTAQAPSTSPAAQPPAVQTAPVAPAPQPPQSPAEVAPIPPAQVPPTQAPTAAPFREPTAVPQAPAVQQPSTPARPPTSPPVAQPDPAPLPPALPAQAPGPSASQPEPEIPAIRPSPTSPGPDPSRPAQPQSVPENPPAAPAPQAPPPAAAPPGAQAALLPVPRPDWRAISAAAVAAAPCGLLSARIEENGFRLGGVLPRAEADAVRQAITRRNLPSGAARLDLGTFDGPFCPLVNALRPVLATPGEGPEVALDGARPLRKGQLLRFAVTLPAWATHLHVAYATSDGAVARLEPGTAGAPGARIRLGDPRPGFPGWRIDEPYGTDLLLVVASEDPLFAPGAPAVEDLAAYARGFAAAVQIARATGRRIALVPVPVDTAP
nr:serine/threonine-protein kinase [Pararoseomonas indoligenes]